MPEIKSTLDLIMEKTKNLTMTEEEKNALHSQELRGKVKGWIQKCIDGTLDTTYLQGEIEREKAKEPELLAILLKEVLERIDPEGENETLFHILDAILHHDPAPVRELIARFQMELAEKLRKKTAEALGDLEKQKISGSAVASNLNRDPQWTEERKQLKGNYIERIHSAAA